MSVIDQTCVPCPCDLLNVGNVICKRVIPILEAPPRLGQLYAAGYTLAEKAPLLLEGVDDKLQRNINDIFIKFSAAIFFPIFTLIIIVFIILLILAYTKLIKPWVVGVIIFISLTILIISAIYIYSIINNEVSIIFTNISDTIKYNWNNNSETIVGDLLLAYNNCNYCESDLRQCTTGCGGTCMNACPEEPCPCPCPPPTVSDIQTVLDQMNF